MPQLHYEPTATKIGDDLWLACPKNNSDALFDTKYEKLTGGEYRNFIKCTTLVKDVILGLYDISLVTGSAEDSTLEVVDGVKQGHVTKEGLLQALTAKYTGVWSPESEGELTGKYAVENADGIKTGYDTLSEAMSSVIKAVTGKLSGGGDNAGNGGTETQ